MDSEVEPNVEADMVDTDIQYMDEFTGVASVILPWVQDAFTQPVDQNKISCSVCVYKRKSIVI